jgi:hypothetical protein
MALLDTSLLVPVTHARKVTGLATSGLASQRGDTVWTTHYRIPDEVEQKRIRMFGGPNRIRAHQVRAN